MTHQNLKKNVIFDFFQITAKDSDGKVTDFPMDMFAETIVDKLPTIVQRVKQINGEEVYLNSLPKDEDYQYFHIVRRRADAPAIGNDNSDQLTDINLEENQFVVEDLSILFDTNLCVAMFQRNRNSIGPTRILEYFNLLLSDISDNEQEILFQPIVRNDTFKTLKRKDVITKIAIKTSDIANSNLPHEMKPLLTPTILDGLELEITLSVGRSRTKTIQKDFADQVINSVEQNPSKILSANVSGGNRNSNNTTYNVEPFDLLRGRLIAEYSFDLGDKKSGNHLKSESVRDQMHLLYNECKSKIITSIGNRNN